MKTFHPLLNPVCIEGNIPFRPKITGLSRVAFRTCDLDNTCRFFTDFLGYGRHTADFAGKERPSSLTIRINGRQHVELLCALPDDVCGLDSFVLETDDAAALRHYLESKGCTVLDAESRTGCFRPDFWVIASSGAACGFVQRADAPDSDPGSADSGISRRISHVGFMTPDPKAAMAFFIGVLGFREIWRGGPDPSKVAWVHLGLPEGDETIELMLFEQRPDRAGMGHMNHICLEVSDVDVARNTLQSRHLPVGCPAPSPISVGINRKRQVNYYDIDGTRVEIMENHTIDGSVAPSSSGRLIEFCKSV